MSDEIKEIINQLEIVARKHTIEVCEDGSKIETMPASVIDELRLNNFSAKVLLDYITNLQEENKELLKKSYSDDVIITKAVEYITSYEAISTIQGLDKIEQNKKIDERTMNVMVERYLKVHHNLLNILQGTDDSNLQDH